MWTLCIANLKSWKLVPAYKLTICKILLQQSPLFSHNGLILIEIHKVIVKEMSSKALNTRASQPTDILSVIFWLLIAGF